MYESSSLQRRVRDLRVAAQHVAVHPRQYIMAGLGSDPGRASGGRPCRTATAARQSLRKKKWSNAWSPGPRLGPWTTIWAGAHTRERTRVGNDHRRRRWRAPRRRRGRHRKVSRRREVLLARHLRPGRNRGCGPSRPGRARQRRHRLGAAVRANRPNANRAGPPPRRDLDRGPGRVWSPPFGGGTHNCLPLPDRNLLIVLDEAVLDNMEDGFKPIWVFDNQVKSNPISIATFPLPNDRDYVAVGGHFGPHNIHENRPGSFQSSRLIFATYQNAGVGIYDITDPFRPVEVGACVPPLRRNSSIRAQTGQSCSTPPTFSSTRTDSATAPIGAVPASTRQEASSRHRARAARSYADRSFRARGRGERSVALRTRHKKGIPARS